MELIIKPTPFDTAKTFAAHFYELSEHLKERGKKFIVALSGGSTPKFLFTILSKEFIEIIDWKNILFFWGDDRMVPPESEESNYGEAKRILFDHIEIPKENIIPVSGINIPEKEAEVYAKKIEELVSDTNGKVVFDLMLLGMGDDGHTASIFPNQIDLFHSAKTCVVAEHPVSGQKRISVTGKIINQSAQVVFLITGKNKAVVLDEIINKKGNYKKYPTALVEPDSGKLFFFLDKEAAELL